MAKGGARVGAGRKKGSVSLKTREIAEQAIKEGLTPLEVILKSMRSMWDNAQEQTDPDQRLTRMAAASQLAKDAAPYIHPKLSSMEVKNPEGETFRTSQTLPPEDKEILDRWKKQQKEPK